MLDTAWPLPALPSVTEERTQQLLLWLVLLSLPCALHIRRKILWSMSHCSLWGSQHWALPQETARLIGDSSPHSQQVSVPQGCGGIHEGLTGSLSQETGSQRGDLQKPNLILFQKSQWNNYFCFPKEEWVWQSTLTTLSHWIDGIFAIRGNMSCFLYQSCSQQAFPPTNKNISLQEFKDPLIFCQK